MNRITIKQYLELKRFDEIFESRCRDLRLSVPRHYGYTRVIVQIAGEDVFVDDVLSSVYFI